jgi:peptide/nickel transport system substrate-binding protein
MPRRSAPTAPGPYRLRERQPNVRTVFVRNGSYWGKIEGNVDEVIFTPIGNDATRVAACCRARWT